jgi:hypothetical protein
MTTKIIQKTKFLIMVVLILVFTMSSNSQGCSGSSGGGSGGSANSGKGSIKTSQNSYGGFFDHPSNLAASNLGHLTLNVSGTLTPYQWDMDVANSQSPHVKLIYTGNNPNSCVNIEYPLEEPYDIVAYFSIYGTPSVPQPSPNTCYRWMGQKSYPTNYNPSCGWDNIDIDMIPPTGSTGPC